MLGDAIKGFEDLQDGESINLYLDISFEILAVGLLLVTILM